MPELPEVEAVARSVRPLIKGRRIRCVHVLHPVVTKPQPPSTVARFAEKRRIRNVERAGKYLLLRFDRGLLTLHFRLDGQLVWFPSISEMLRRANQPKDGVHVDLALELSNGILALVDQRHFGRVHAWDSVDACPALARLGADAFSPEFTADSLTELLSSSRRPLKEFLLDQSRIAGIGNIYSCESLWHARLSPCRLASLLSPAEARRLHKAIVSLLQRALECCLHPAPDFRDPAWWFQGLESILRVYGRAGKPCRRCLQPIKRITQGSRSTYFCARCQR